MTQGIDERKMMLYNWLVEKGKIDIEQVPEPYKTELQKV